MVGGVEECIDGIGVKCVSVGRAKIVVEERRWWAVCGHDLSNGDGCCVHGGYVVRNAFAASCCAPAGCFTGKGNMSR